MEKTLGEILSDKRISRIAQDAIRKWDLSKEEMWNKTLSQLRADHFGGELREGFDRLFAAAETGEWYYPLYSGAECAEDPEREGTNLVWFPSPDASADDKPFILLVPGGGFVNVWNLTEGWPVANQFNRLGYHVFILTYQVDSPDRQLERDLGDFAQALRLIAANASKFRVRADRYITCGFSAGGYLVCLWNTEMGYPAFGLPKPRATFPVYPVVTLRPEGGCVPENPEAATWLYGCDLETARRSAFEIPEHAEGFPPCAVFLAAGDDMVLPENSKLLAAALEKHGIPCYLEIGPTGGHGFADGTGMCMAGWTERAVRWFEKTVISN